MRLLPIPAHPRGRASAIAVVTLSLLLGAWLAGCPQGPVTVVPNTPPLIRIEQPIPGPSGDPIPVEEDVAVPFIAMVEDAEDDLQTLSIHWLAERTDTTADVVDLGDSQADNEGWTEKLVGGLEPGRWSITGEVEDSNGAVDSATIPIEVLSDNSCPAVTISQPEQDQTYTGGEVITFVATVNDDRGLEGMSVEWFSNLDGLLDVVPPTNTGLLTFSRNNLTVGDQVVTLTVTDPEGAACPVAVEFVIIPSDLPPFDFLIEIDPAAPLTVDDLRCLITQGSADPEGQPIVYTYVWYHDGVPALNDGDLVTADQTAAEEEWTCEVTANDGTLDSNPALASVVVNNTLPTLDDAVLGPEPAFENSTLFCEGFGFDDFDGDPEGYVAAWFVNSLPVPGLTDVLLVGTWFDRGQDVWCELRPFDGYDAGEAVTSNVVTIQNSPPGAPTISMTPAPAATIDSDLSCLIDMPAVDPDGDPILNPDSYQIEWYVNGDLDPSSSGLWILPGVKTALGEEWTCEVRATDGTEWGDWASANTEVMPLSGDLVITEFMAAPTIVADVAGEWIEIYNASGTTMSLLGFELHDDGVDSHVITDDIVLPSGTRVVLARNGDYLTNGSVLAAYEYSGVVLDDPVDQIVLSFDGDEVDRIEYDLSLYPAGTPGHSLSWDPAVGIPSPLLNDDPANWCHSGTPIGLPGLTDFGTPGGTNDPCACFLSDGDGDGWGDDVACPYQDCDDGDLGFNPGADDICEDGIDQNCDGFDAICWCPDTDDDGDGFGDGLACNPADCNDSDPSIYPGAVEACDSVDQDCDGLPDNGDPFIMCPTGYETSTTLCSGGDCYVSTCAGGHYDVDTFYSTGCECDDDTYADSCGTAADFGEVNSGSITVDGVLPVNTDVDWIRVSFPAGSGRPGGGTPSISFAARPSSDYYFSLYYNCSGTQAVCGSGAATGRTEYSFVDDQSNSAGYSSNGSAWPDDIYIKVYRTGGAPTCTHYQLEVSR
jgi:hypothetical protein